MNSQLLRFECEYLTKQISFVSFTLLFFAFGALVTADSIGQSMLSLNANAPYRFNFFIAIASVLAVLPSMVLCVNLVLRDLEHKFDGIVGAIALDKLLQSRFIAILVANIILVAAFALGLWIGLQLGLRIPTLQPSAVSPLQLSHYIWPMLIFALPNIFICTTFIFAITHKYQHALITYLAGIGLFGLFWVAVLTIGAPIAGTSVIAQGQVTQVFALIDPFATSAFFEQTQFWTTEQKNQQMISAEGLLLVNRIIWLALSALVFIKVSAKWRNPLINHALQSSASSSKKTTAKTIQHAKHSPTSLTWITPDTTSTTYNWQTFKTLLAFELNQIATDGPFRFALMAWSAIVLAGAVNLGSSGGEFSGDYPTTSILVSFLAEPLNPLAMMLIIYYCGEKVWQERLIKFDSLLDSSPINSTINCAAKLLSLVLLPIAMIALLMVISVSYQLINGYYQLNISHYLSMFYFFGLPIVVQTIWVLFVQTLIAQSRFANKYLGLIISAITLVLFANLTSLTGLAHPLLQFNQFPSLLRVHTDLNGYGLFASQFHWFAALWSAVAMIVFILTARYWRRGELSAVSKR